MGNAWQFSSSVIEAAIGAQRSTTTQTGQRARVVAVQALVCEHDNALYAERQKAVDDYKYSRRRS